MNARRSGPLALALLLLAAPALPAQTVGAELAYYGISIGDVHISEFTLPVGVTYRLGGIRFDANTAVAVASMEANGVSSSLSGLTDITARVMLPLMQDRARLVLAANLPTGTSALKPDQLPVAAALTTDLLTLPVTSFGSGSGMTTGLAVSRTAGPWVLGGMAALRVGSAYEPLVGTAAGASTEFRPGEELRLRVAAERPSTSGVSVRLGMSWSTFAQDQSDGVGFYDRGNRLLGEAVVELPVGRGAAVLYAWDLNKSAGAAADAGLTQVAPASNLLAVGGRASMPLRPDLSLRPVLELVTQATASETVGPGDGMIVRVGAGVEKRFGNVILAPTVVAQFGSLDGESIRGLVLRGGVAWTR